VSRIDSTRLDREPDASSIKVRGNAGTCPVGALPHQFLEIGDGGKRQGDGYAVGFGFFCGHAKKLASYGRY